MLPKDKFRGCLLGLAVADCLGSQVEFRPRGSFPSVTDMTGGGPFRLKPGQFTDDTSMALCLAASFIDKQRFDPQDQMHKFDMWHRQGYMSSTGRCFDIGGTCASALSVWRQRRQPFSGSTSRHAAGNGSLMRLAPVPMFYANRLEKAGWMSLQSSRTTHQAPQCLSACRFYGALIAAVLNGVSNVSAWSRSILDCHLDRLDPEVVNAVIGAKHKTRNQINSTGYVVHTLEAALWSFYHSRDYGEGVLLAANLGDDADTVAAVYGMLAGAYFGARGIPQKWLDKLAMRIKIELMADELHALAHRERSDYVGVHSTSEGGRTTAALHSLPSTHGAQGLTLVS